VYALFFYFVFKEDEPVSISIMGTAAQLPFLILSTYLQLYLLIPKFLLKRKFLLYFFLSAIFIKLAVNISVITFSLIVIPLRTGHTPIMQWSLLWTITARQVYPFFGVLSIIGLAASIKLLKRWYIENDRNKKIEQEKTNMELAMLKVQVHPQFLFNTLNNLYTLSSTQSSKAPLAVTHLSDLLRYMLYESNDATVPLDNEIAILKKYVELEKLRYGHAVDISFSYSGNTGELMIAPLLLLPFVENSFNCGVGDQVEQSWINMHLHAAGDMLSFNLSNSFNKATPSLNSNSNNLQNIKKRLELIYAGKYELIINEEEDMYTVKLQIQLLHSPAKVAAGAVDAVKLKPVSLL
jgi:sensor histidine kinase YesM